MIHYTDALTDLIGDIVERVDALSFIDPNRLLVFARSGRSRAAGAYATCHSLNLPTSTPGYYFWRDRDTGVVTRRSECFVTKTPEVFIRRQRLEYLISFAIPRFCDQVLGRARKAEHYPGGEPWLAKLDTVVHELYHIAPDDIGLRRFKGADGHDSGRSHGPRYLEEVADFVRQYLNTRPDPRKLEFLRYDFAGLVRRFGGVVGTTFQNYPSYPQRYHDVVEAVPGVPEVEIVPLVRSRQPRRYSDGDLQLRLFTSRGSRRIRPTELDSAA
jgi:hypothetical protein